MAETLEQKVGAPPTAKNPVENPEEKKPKFFENMRKEFSELPKWIGNSALSATMLGTSYALGGLDALALVGSYPISGMVKKSIKKKPFDSSELRDQTGKGLVGGLLTFGAIKSIQNLSDSYGLDGLANGFNAAVPIAFGLTLAAMPAINFGYEFFKYIIDNKKIKGVIKHYKDNFLGDTKKYMLRLLPVAGMVAASVAIPAYSYLLFPAVAAYNVLNRATYNLSAYVSSAYKTVKDITVTTFKLCDGFMNSFYRMGQSISKFMEGRPKAPEKQPA
ncbi:MAG: hypothetical protein AABX33_05245 [Nanoarchaeota archaeon]